MAKQHVLRNVREILEVSSRTISLSRTCIVRNYERVLDIKIEIRYCIYISYERILCVCRLKKFTGGQRELVAAHFR